MVTALLYIFVGLNGVFVGSDLLTGRYDLALLNLGAALFCFWVARRHQRVRW